MSSPLEKFLSLKSLKVVTAFALVCSLSFPVLPAVVGDAYADSLGAAKVDDAPSQTPPRKAWDIPAADSTIAPSDSAAATTFTPASTDGAVTLQGSFEDVPETSGSFKFILRWGEQPLDLDSHIDGYRPDGYPIHVYYSDSEADYNEETYCALDHDDTDSYGPETIKLASSSSFPCYYYIHNFSESPSMTISGATVEIYKGGTLISKLSIPTRGYGDYWNIGAVVNGEFIPKGGNGTITRTPDLSYVGFSRWTGTSTSKRKYPDFDHKVGNLDHYMVNTKSIANDYYPDFNAFLKKSYPIPGLENSVVAGDDDCDARVPQGICVTPDYILISAYCAGPKIKSIAGDKKHTNNDDKFLKELAVHGENYKLHDAAIYALDRVTGAYVATITLKGSASYHTKTADGKTTITGDHVGGLAFDGSHVWVATSNLRSNTSTGDLLECMIDYSALKTAASQGDNGSIDFGGSDARMISLDGGSLNSASFNTFHDGLLWVGNNKSNDITGLCHLIGYKYESGKLVKKKDYRIPAGGNGATFVTSGNKTYLILNTSEGRNAASTAYRWNVTNAVGSNVFLLPWTTKYSLPPMLEEACVYDGNLYTVYESGATLYSCFSSGSGRATQNVDEVCVAPVADFLSTSPTGKNSDQGDAKKSWNKSGKARISVACPVNVYLEDAYGYTVASIVDGEVEIEDDSVYAWIDGDEKSFLVPNDQGFRLVVDAYAEGEMDVSVTEYDENGEVATASYRENVSLTDGERFSGTLDALSDEGSDDEGDGEDYEETPIVSASDAFNLQSITKLESNPDDDSSSWIPETSKVSDSSSLARVELTVTSEGPGAAAGAGEVVEGDYAALSATPEDDAKFIGWYEDGECVSTDADLVVKADAAASYVAKFAEVDYAIDHVKVEGDGYVTADADDLTAEVGSEIEVQAVADELSLFDGWYLDGECVSTSKWYWFESQSDEGLTAKFESTPAAHVSITTEGPGYAETVSSDEKVGGEAEVIAIPDQDCIFLGWYIGKTCVTTSTSYWFDIEDDVALVAKFDVKRPASVTVKADGPGKATIGDNDGYIGGWAEVYAVPDSNAEFVGFYIGSNLVEEDDYYEFKITGDTAITAKFKSTKVTVATTSKNSADDKKSAATSKGSADGKKSATTSKNSANDKKTTATSTAKTPTHTAPAATTVTAKKKANPLKAKAKVVKIKYKKLKKKTQKVAAKKAFKLTGAKGKVTYKVAKYDKKAKKKITVAKNGKVTVKKGLKRGTYKLKVKVTAAGNTAYKKSVKSVTLKIKVK